MSEKTSPETAREIVLGSLGACQDNSPTSYARARIMGVNPDRRSERVRAIVDIMEADAWVTGETAAELAGAWGTSLSLVEGDASDASLVMKVYADKKEVVMRVWTSLVSMLQTAERALAKGEEFYHRQFEAPKLSAANFNFASSGLARLIESVDKTLEKVARVADIFPRDKGAAFSVLIDARGELRPELADMLEVVASALEPYPEAAVAVADRLAEWRARLSGDRKVVITSENP